MNNAEHEDLPEAKEEENSENTFTQNPVLKKIAKLNGEINRMSIRQLQGILKSHGLDTRGKKDVLKKRLKTFYKKIQLSTANIKDPNGISYYYKYLVIIDFEATCDVGQPNSYRQEIIEFPAVLLSIKKREIIDEFHCYVRPVINPKLTKFCTSLTGITQEMVNNASFFPQVLSEFEDWLKKHDLSCTTNNFAVVSDGPWDMGRFLVEQCRISKLSLPEWGKKWINIRKTYSNFYDTKRICLKDMLMRLGMRFEGTPHSGIDDSRNIARITLMLMRDGANLRINERVREKGDSNSCYVVNVSRREFEESYRRKKGRVHHDPEPDDSRHSDSVEVSESDLTSDKERGSSDQYYYKDLKPSTIPIVNDSEFPLLNDTTRGLSTLTIK